MRVDYSGLLAGFVLGAWGLAIAAARYPKVREYLTRECQCNHCRWERVKERQLAKLEAEGSNVSA